MIRPLVFALALVTTPLLAADPIDQGGWEARKEFVRLKNRQRIAYVEYGDPRGTAVILLHGFTDTSRSWTQVAPALSAHRVIIPDQRGHGASATPECCYALADFAYDIKLLMDKLKIDRASIAGHSLGSLIAMEFAATYPERVDRLVIAGSTGKAPVTRSDWLVEGALSVTAPVDPDSEFLSAWFAPENAVKTSADPAFLAAVLVDGKKTKAQVWRGVARALVDVEGARLAADIAAPALIVAGSKDDLFPAEHQQALRRALPDADYIEFDGLGHNMIWEQPERVAPAIADFLNAQRP